MSDVSPTVLHLMERILAETDRLRRDVVALANRIEPFEDQAPGMAGTPEPLRLREHDQVIDFLKGLRRSLVTSEYHLNAIRGRIEEIASDAMLRDELKPWIKPAGRKR